MNIFLRVIPTSTKRVTLCLKVFLCIYNLVFVVMGLILVAVGSLGMSYLEIFLHLAARFSLYVQIVFILTGVALFVFGLLGAVAALISSAWMLRLYGVCVSVVFLAELTTGIVGYIYRSEVQSIISKAYKDAQFKYTGNDTNSAFLDAIQAALGCCGHRVFNDWGSSPYFKASGIPVSCCIKKEECTTTVLKDTKQAETKVYNIGCFTLLSQVMLRYMGVVAGVAIGIGFFQLIGVTLACCLSRYITHSFIGMPR